MKILIFLIYKKYLIMNFKLLFELKRVYLNNEQVIL